MSLNKLTATCQLLLKTANFSLLYKVEQFTGDYKMAPEWKVKNDPADTSLKEDVSIYTTLDPLLILVRHSL